jgi:hypothetical protein
LSVVLFAGEL